MKGKRVGKKDANSKTTQRCVIEEETEVLSVKHHHRPTRGNQSTRQLVGIHELARDPPSLIYLMYLSPPSSYSNQASWNRVLSSSPNLATSSMLHLQTLASSNASKQHQNPTEHFKRVWQVFGLSTFQGYENGEVGVKENPQANV